MEKSWCLTFSLGIEIMVLENWFGRDARCWNLVAWEHQHFKFLDPEGKSVAILWGQDWLNIVADLLCGWHPMLSCRSLGPHTSTTKLFSKSKLWHSQVFKMIMVSSDSHCSNARSCWLGVLGKLGFEAWRPWRNWNSCRSLRHLGVKTPLAISILSNPVPSKFGLHYKCVE